MSNKNDNIVTLYGDLEKHKKKSSKKKFNFSRYIHMTKNYTIEIEKSLFSPITNKFLVYTLTNIQDEDNETKKVKLEESSKCLGQATDETKSPRSSNLFSFVSRLKRTKGEGKSPLGSTEILLQPKNIDVKTSSKIPIHLKRLHSKSKFPSNHNLTSSMCAELTSYATRPSDTTSAGTSLCSSTEEICGETNYETKLESGVTTLALARINPDQALVATSYMDNKDTYLKIKVADSFRDVIDIIDRVQESEKHVCDTIAKYIQDQKFKIELKEYITNYVKLHVEAERRAQSLSQDIWQQQIDLYKSKELSLRDSVDSLVKKNRKLQEDNELLLKKNDILSSKVAFQVDAGLSSSFPQRGSYVVEGMNRANEKLRMKLLALKTQIENVDDEMQRLKDKNTNLEEQLRYYTSQLKHNKDAMRRSSADHQIEVTGLYRDIRINTDTIRRNCEVGNILLEDLNVIKKQVKCIDTDANWPQLKASEANLTDIIDLARTCIKELSKELHKQDREFHLKEKDMEHLNKEGLYNIEKILELELQNNNLVQKLKDKEELIINNFATEETLQSLKEFINKAKTEIELKSKQIEELNASQESTLVDKEILEIEMEKLKAEEKNARKGHETLNQENSYIKLQLQELNNLLFTTGTANIVRDLNLAQQQIVEITKKCNMLEGDKKSLNEKIQQQELERQSLSVYQDNCFTYFRELQKEVEKITATNDALKTKLEDKKSQISALQIERKKNLEEKEVLKQIYEKLKSESSKVVVLEGTVSNINKEATRLAKIAEYNKKLGEQLKTEVVERDEVINKLKGNLDKLNEIQEVNVKEKVSLCEELTEICHWKDALDGKLAVEVQRNMVLAEYRNEVENCARKQIEMIEEKYLKQSNDLDLLVDKFKLLETENENLNIQLATKHAEIHALEATLQELKCNYENCQSQLEEARQITAECNVTTGALKTELDDTASQLKFQISTHQKVVTELQTKIKSDSDELENMDRTIQFLQNNIQKVQNDLDRTRETQKEHELIFEKEKHKNEILQLTLEQKLKIIEDFETERNKELRKIISLTESYNKLSAEYEDDIKKASNAEKAEKEHLNAVQHELFEKNYEIKSLKQKIDEFSTKINTMECETKILESQIKNNEDMSEEVNNKSLLLKESLEEQNRLKEDLQKEKTEVERLQIKYSDAKKKTALLRNDIHSSEKYMENQKKLFKKSFDSLEHEFTAQKNVMHNDVLAMHERVQEISADYINQKNSRIKYEEAHKALAEKLLKSVKMLVEEKIAKQTVDNKIVELTDRNSFLQREKILLEEKANDYKQTSENLKKENAEEHRRYKSICKQFSEYKLKKSIVEQNSIDQEGGELKRLIDHISASVLPSSSNPLRYNDHSRSSSRQRSKLLTKIQTYKVSLEKSHKNYIKLQEEFGILQEKYTVLEFQKSEILLRLHETQVRLGVHENMVLELKDSARKVLTVLLQMRDDGAVDRGAAETLMFLMKS